MRDVKQMFSERSLAESELILNSLHAGSKGALLGLNCCSSPTQDVPE